MLTQNTLMETEVDTHDDHENNTTFTDAHDNGPCRPLTKKVLRRTLQKMAKLHTKAFGVLPFDTGDSQNIEVYQEASRYHDGETAAAICPAEHMRVKACPFEYHLHNVDPNRYPIVIPEARCLCEDCLNSLDRECQPVYYNVKVLKRKGCVGGVYKYEFGFERVAVSCACVRVQIL